MQTVLKRDKDTNSSQSDNVNGSKNGRVEVDSRFGKVTIDLSKEIFMEKGLVGMDDDRHFCLANYPMDGADMYKVFHCTKRDDLSFITIPVSIENDYIEKSDLENACKELGYDSNNCIILLLVTITRTALGSEICANLRAPVIIDTVNKVGCQHIFHNNKYEVRHQIN